MKVEVEVIVDGHAALIFEVSNGLRQGPFKELIASRISSLEGVILNLSLTERNCILQVTFST